MTRLVILTTLILWLGNANARITDNNNKVFSPKKATNDILTDAKNAQLFVRGGESSERKKKKKKKKRKESSLNQKNKDAVNQALQQDAASALGDAIRDRAEILLQDTLANSIEDSVCSIGWAMGSSDRRDSFSDAGGVEVAPASVVVHYFLKSHGGAHALQTFCSVLAAVVGIAACWISNTSLIDLKITLLRRCMMFAMIKHVAGLLGASLVAAQGIRNAADFAKTRKLLQQLATDPVSQYVFYTACVLLWLPIPTTKTKTMLDTKSFWWQSHRVVPFILTGPVVLREMISSALVVSDVLVLWACSSASDVGSTIKRLLSISQSIIDAFMSLLVSASTWRSSNASQRQAILAKLTSKISLFLELCVGIIFIIDSISGLLGFLFTSSADRPGALEILKRLTCTRLYLQFLYTRRRKIQRLATTIRGGASQVPFYVLSVLMDPRSSIGLPKKKSSAKETDQWTWGDYIRIALGFDEA
jgi:hypothetical protein